MTTISTTAIIILVLGIAFIWIVGNLLSKIHYALVRIGNLISNAGTTTNGGNVPPVVPPRGVATVQLNINGTVGAEDAGTIIGLLQQ